MRTSDPQNTNPSWLQRKWLPESIIFLIAFGIYANTLGHSFTQDDAIVIYDNDFTRQGFNGLKDIFSKDTFAGFFKEEGKSNLVSGGRYRPMTLAVFTIIYELVGDKPFAFHLFVTISYALLCLTIYWLLSMMEIGKSYSKLLLAFIATIIFAIHPIHTEAVANVKGLDEIWSLQWTLLAMMAGVQYIKKSNLLYVLLSSLCLIIGLLSKENAIVWVLIIPITLWYFVKDASIKKISFISASLTITAILYLIIRTQVIGWSMGSSPQEMMNNPFIKQVNGSYLPFTTGEKSATILYSLGKYIKLLFFPHPLTHDYYPRHIGVMTWSESSVWMSGIMHMMMMGIALLGIRKKSFVTFCIFYFYITLGLMTNILFPIGTHLSERFLFTPSLGFALLAALGWHHLSDGSNRKYLTYLGILLLMLMGIKTITRNAVWKNDFTLFTTDVKVSKNSAKVRNAAAGALIHKSTEIQNKTEKEYFLNEALSHLSVATTIHPNYKNAHLLTGNAHTYLGDYSQAISSYDRVLSLSPGDTDATQNLLLALREGARKAGSEQKDYPLAIEYLERAIQMMPKDHESISLLGIAHGSNENHREAIKYFQKAIQLKPDIARNYVHLAYAQLNLGEEEDAQINLQRAVEIDPNALN